uniref:Jumonji domain-containing protein 4 n=1 Tax=Macrostomum lignano TaxID=282301 RepID=A0A1I8ISJ6_9PLAT
MDSADRVARFEKLQLGEKLPVTVLTEECDPKEIYRRTPFHCDVFGSYSWSANIAGRKLWILLPPGQEKKLLCRNRLPWDLGECSSETLSSLSGIRLLQEPGDVLFVPSGWHHQVANLEACISINHNWFNACNARHCHDRFHYCWRTAV